MTRLRPGPVLLWLLAGWMLVGVAAGFHLVPVLIWGNLGGVILIIALAQMWELVRTPSPPLQREVAPAVPLGHAVSVCLRLHGAGRRLRILDVHDLHPGDWAPESVGAGLPARLRLPPDGQTTLTYQLTPAARGAARFTGCHVRIHSTWRLWTQQRTLPVISDIRVYPDFAPLAHMAGLSVEIASRTMGAHLKRRRGEGTEFEELRDYRVGDALRRIDWKASARMGHFISREYHEERNQQIVLLLDCGRRMLARDGALSHFDHVLNASLALAFIALREGDAVGLLASQARGREQRWLAPQRGSGAMNRLLGIGYDLQAEPAPIDYLAAAGSLLERQQRRALVIMITNLRDEDDQELAQAAALLARRHLVLVVSLSETAVEQAARATDSPGSLSLDTAIRSAAAMHYLAQRDHAHSLLRQRGVMTLDIPCERLSGALIERYLKLKRDAVL